MTPSRLERVRRQLIREITAILQDLKDPRIGFVTVTSAEVTPDLRHAKIFVSVLGNSTEQNETFQTLCNATGFVRTQIGHRMRLRFTPEIAFAKDDSLEHVTRIYKIMDELKAKEGRAP